MYTSYAWTWTKENNVKRICPMPPETQNFNRVRRRRREGIFHFIHLSSFNKPRSQHYYFSDFRQDIEIMSDTWKNMFPSTTALLPVPAYLHYEWKGFWCKEEMMMILHFLFCLFLISHGSITRYVMREWANNEILHTKKRVPGLWVSFSHLPSPAPNLFFHCFYKELSVRGTSTSSPVPFLCAMRLKSCVIFCKV